MAASIAIEIESGSSVMDDSSALRLENVRHHGYWAGSFGRESEHDSSGLVKMASDLQRWSARTSTS